MIPARALGLAFVTVLCAGAAQADGAGDISYADAPSVALGHPVHVAVYLPAAPAPTGGWPVLYLLHGLGGSAESWPRLGKIDATLDEMIAAGQIAPMVVIMPDAKSSWYVDSDAVGGPGEYATALLNDLPAWVEAQYPVRHDRGGRMVAGLSMGGYGALRFALLQPDRFVAAAALSPAIWQNVPAEDLDMPPDQLALLAETDYFHRVDPETIEAARDLPPPGKHFQGAFGTPFNARFFNAQNVFTLLMQRIDQKAVLPSLYVTVGDDDSHHLWRGAIAFYETMQAAGQPSELRITDGDHTWDLWRVSIRDALAFLNGCVTPAP